MAEQTERVDHYQELMKMTGKFTGLEGLAQGTLSENAEERALIRQRGIDQFNYNALATDEQIRDGFTAKALEERAVAIEYFGAHRDEVISGIDGSKLERAVYDVMPQIGFIPGKKEGRGGDVGKKHKAYIGARQLFERAVHGDLKEMEMDSLNKTAIDEAVSQSQEALAKRGIDPEKYKEVYALTRISAETSIRLARDKIPIVLAYANKAVERAKNEFDASFDEGYTKEMYARELISDAAARDPLGALRGIYQLHKAR